MLTSALLLTGTSLLITALVIQAVAIWTCERRVVRRGRLAHRLRALAPADGANATLSLPEHAATLAELGRSLRSPNGRRWAVEVAGELKGPGLVAGAVAVLDAELARGEEARGERRGARILGALAILRSAPDPLHLSLLIGAILDPVLEVSAAAALTAAAAPLEYGGAVVPLATRVRDAEPEIRPVLLWSLETLLAAAPKLIPDFGRDPDPAVRRAALAAAERALADGPDEDLRRHLGMLLIEAVDDPDEATAVRALQAAPGYDERELLRACGVAASSRHGRVPFAACRALSRFPSSLALPLLVEAISGLPEEQSHRICTELEERPAGLPDNVRESLLATPRDRRRWAVRILAAVEGEDAAAEVWTALEDDEPLIRVAAAQAAGSILLRARRQQDAGPMLEALLQRWVTENDPAVIVPLADALADSGTTEANEALLRRFVDFPAGVQDRIVETLARAEQDLAIPPHPSPEPAPEWPA